jgi:hypothetical protein
LGPQSERKPDIALENSIAKHRAYWLRLIRPRWLIAFGHLESASLLNAKHGNYDLDLDGTAACANAPCRVPHTNHHDPESVKGTS